jgi:uncharacterized membrane protein YoaK (UPF0700 family)
MKKRGVFFKATALILLSLIISSVVSLSAFAATASAAQDNGVTPSTSSVTTADSGAEDDAIPSWQGDTVEHLSALVIILVSMSIFAFGALATKLFDNRITNKELLILLFVLIFVIVVILIALYMMYIGKSGGSAEALATFNQKLFWEVI